MRIPSAPDRRASADRAAYAACRPGRPADGRRRPAGSGPDGGPQRRSGRIVSASGSAGIVRRPGSRWPSIAVAELVLWTVARVVPLPWAPRPGRRSRGRAARLAGRRRPRPTRLGETALAVDGEGHLGDRVSSALELAAAFPASAGPADPEAPTASSAIAAETDRFVRRQRARRPAPLRSARRACSRRACRDARRSPCRRGAAARAGPPRPEPTGRRHRPAASGAAAERQADQLDRVADELEAKGEDAKDPGPGSPRNCASWPASSATSPTTSMSTWRGWGRSRPTSVPRSTQPMSSGRRR